MSMKNSDDTLRIEPANFRLVAQCHNQLCHRVPLSHHVAISNHNRRFTLWLLQSFSENIPTITFIQTLHCEILETLIDCFVTSGKEGRYQVILKKVDVPVVPRDACLQSLRKTRLGPYFKLHESFICAGGVRGKDTCKVMISR
jgi:hypothetical protein